MKYELIEQATSLMGGAKEPKVILQTFNPEEVAIKLRQCQDKLKSWGYETQWIHEAGVSGKKGVDYVSYYSKPPVTEEAINLFLLEEDRPDPDGGLPDETIRPTRLLTDGTYTVEYADKTWRTFRVRTQDKNSRFAPGQTIISYLSGPNNDSSGGDWTQFAFYDPDHNSYHIWKRHNTDSVAMQKIREGLGIMLQDPNEAAKGYALKSGRCSRCNRKLTVPASLHMGLGPDCAGMIGG